MLFRSLLIDQSFSESEDFSSYFTSDGRYVRIVDPRPRPADYKINVKFKPNKSSLRYSTDCQMFVVE